MLVAQSPISGHQRPKSGRKPLQPKNPSSSPFNTTATNTKLKPNPAGWIEISQIDSINKENVAPIYSTPANKESFPIESFDASLAEELNAIRQKLERMRADKEKTEKMLRERALLLDLQVEEILDRGVLQKQLEIEVDRLYRLKEIKLSCMKLSPFRSLREKEQVKIKQGQSKASSFSSFMASIFRNSEAKNQTGNMDELKQECPLQSPNAKVKIEN